MDFNQVAEEIKAAKRSAQKAGMGRTVAVWGNKQQYQPNDYNEPGQRDRRDEVRGAAFQGDDNLTERKRQFNENLSNINSNLVPQIPQRTRQASAKVKEALRGKTREEKKAPS